MNKIISEYKTVSAKYNRLMEVFPHATENDDKTTDELIEKTHKFKLSEYNSSFKQTLLKFTIGKIDFYTYTKQGFSHFIEPCEKIAIEANYDALKYLEFRDPCELVEQYIETGSCDFQAILKKIYEKEKKVVTIKEPSKEIEIIKRELLRKGRLLIDKKFHEFFIEFPIDKEGYHCV